jgi:hypothetical protein
MFDWSVLDRNSIINHLLILSPKLCNREITFWEFHNILSKFLKKSFPITITSDLDEKVKHHKVFIGGTYYSDHDENDRKCIQLNLYYNPVIEEFTVSSRRFKGICKTIADTILHEIIHMRQYRRRNFKALPNYASTASSSRRRDEQEYLGCSDEIDAYGFNIACELLEKYDGDHRLVIRHLDLDLSRCKKSSNSWKMYLKAFEHNHKHEIIKRVKRKVIRYLPRADEGRPFKSRDWICH